jgi:tetratricopeptide (TPR) repeat protein
MAIDRVEALKAILAQDPNSTFARYGLAQAYATAGRYVEAVAEYEAIMAGNPDYVAAYFHAGQALERIGDVEQARRTYERGINACARTGDAHTRSELQGALDMLPI